MRKRLTCALLLAALLAGCAAGAQPVQQPDQSVPVQSGPVVEPVADAPAGPVFVDEPDSPYPMAEESWSVDMDGDGVDELVELRAEKAYAGNGIEPDKWFEVTDYGLHPYTLVVTKGETVCELPLGRDSNDDTPLYPWYYLPDADRTRTRRFWTEDRAGRPVLVLAFDTISAGGAGHIDVYAVTLQDGALVSLPVPEYGIRAALDEETLTARLTVPETGYTDTLDLNQWLAALNERNPQFNWKPHYREDGSLEWPVAPGEIDGHYWAEKADGGVTLRQYLWGSTHMDGMGDLVTTLSWEDGESVALDQYFDWY